jgi:hypothetical protein
MPPIGAAYDIAIDEPQNKYYIGSIYEKAGSYKGFSIESDRGKSDNNSKVKNELHVLIPVIEKYISYCSQI